MLRIGYLMTCPPAEATRYRATRATATAPSLVCDSVEAAFHELPRGPKPWTPARVRDVVLCWNHGFAYAVWHRVARAWKPILLPPPHVHSDVEVPAAWTVRRTGTGTPVPPPLRVYSILTRGPFEVLGNRYPCMIRDTRTGAIYTQLNDDGDGRPWHWEISWAECLVRHWNCGEGVEASGLWHPAPGTVLGAAVHP